MQKLKKTLALFVIIFLLIPISYAQATFDPVEHQKRMIESKALEKAKKAEIKNKLQTHKDSLLALLPKPYVVRKNNPDYSPNAYTKGDFAELEKKELMINNYVLPKLEDSANEYCNEFKSTHEKTFDSEDDRNSQVELAKKIYIGAYIYKNLNDTISEDYIKYVDIPETDRFLYIENKYIQPKYYLEKYSSHYSYNEILYTAENPEIITSYSGKINVFNLDDKYFVERGENGSKIVLQNTKSKLFYVVNSATYEKDYINENEVEKLLKKIPLTTSELNAIKTASNLLIAKYRAGIKSADINRMILASIQRKYLTRGYFDESKVGSLDKQKYNQNLKTLKDKAVRLKSLLVDQDSDEKVFNKLNLNEIQIFNDIMYWRINVIPIH